MSEPTGGNRLSEMGGFIRLIGWAIFVASIFFALKSKVSGLLFIILFWVCFAVLVIGSISYSVARCFSERWKSKAVRSYFSPYIVGAITWILLILFLVVLNRVAG